MMGLLYIPEIPFTDNFCYLEYKTPDRNCQVMIVLHLWSDYQRTNEDSALKIKLTRLNARGNARDWETLFGT
jgi:hypothetical protein